MTRGRQPPRRLLLTGATGFVGSHVIEAFVETGVPVRALVRRTSDTRRLERAGVALVEGALTDPASLRRATEDVAAVVHLAALTRARTEAEYHHVNADGTAVLARTMAETASAPRRFVYLSSLAAVGPAIDGRPVGPDDTPRPLTAYGRSKLAGEVALADVTELESVVLRAPAVYGPRDRDLYRFFKLAARGVLPLPAGAQRRLQLIHVRDLADALVRAAMTPDASGVLHVAEPTAYPWETVAAMIADAVGTRARILRVPAGVIAAAAAVSEGVARLVGQATIFNRDKARELLAPGWLCETDRAREILGFSAATPLADGLRQTARWYRDEGWL